MTSVDIKTLERQALEQMKQGDFGPDSIRVNAAIVEQAPGDERAWTRLGRCHLEQRQFDEAVAALRAALSINPSNGIATSLLVEVRKRRALTPTAIERVTTGFSSREFALLETLGTDDACRTLRPRIEALFDSINASSVAVRIVEARQRQGESGSKLFHANSFHAGEPGHIFAFHHGGRWEPQFNLGWFAESSVPACFRAGVGFNVSPGGRDMDRASGQEQTLRYFERFQQTVEKSWQRELARWMGTSGGFIQYGHNPPALDMLPDRAVEWLITCRNAAALEWIFIGRWLFLDRPDEAKILGDRGKLAAVVDDTFRTLYPLWLTTYTGSPPE
jgi:tetratricopeptide (TPR) repeat protein